MKTCLVVDDSKMIRRVASRILSDLKFQPEEAENGEEAMKLCRAQMPDAILLDWNMPVMDGMDFLKALNAEIGAEMGAEMRAKNSDKKPVVIFCTAERDVLRIAEALDAGADEYIMKPFDSDILSSKLHQLGLLGA